MQKPNKINNFHLTFDIDWAPDFCVELILNLLNKKNIKAKYKNNNCYKSKTHSIYY